MHNKPTLKTEIWAGTTTFFALAYIVIVNPQILHAEGAGIPFAGAATATVLLSFLMTLLMGLYAKMPIAVAPGMGVNAFFAATLIKTYHIPWPTALGMVFLSGVLFVILSITPLRVWLAQAIPSHIRIAITAGLGLFIALIGLKNMGMISSHPDTFLTWQAMNKKSIFSVCGLLVSIFFLQRKRAWALLAGMAIVLFLGWLFHEIPLLRPTAWFKWPDFQSAFLQLDIKHALSWSLLPAICAMVFTDFFDSIATFVGVAHATPLTHVTEQRMKQGLLVDALSTLTAGLLGTSSGTAYMESAAGIEVGGRTGRTAVVAALWFLPFLFVAPLLETIPDFVTAPVLIIVGTMMLRPLLQSNLHAWEDLLPLFAIVVLIPFSFSITQGMLWGFVLHVLCYVMAGRAKEISFSLYTIGAGSAGLLVAQHAFWQKGFSP